MSPKLRPYIARVSVFLLTLSVSLTFLGARWIYVNRQGLFGAAAYDGRVTTMKLIELFGVDINSPACSRCPLPLVNAAWGGSPEAVEFLLDRGADINEAGNFDHTPLMMASFYGNTEMVRLLLERGADVNFRDANGDTALSFAKQRKHAAVIRLLRQAGATDGPLE
jgi:ankyrin repeat protein